MQPYTKRTWTEINLDCLEHNYHQIKALLPQTDIIATVKADGYGHCAEPVARHLQELGVHFFSVSNIDEATALRDDQIQGDILILGYTPVEQAEELVKYNIIQTVFSPEFAQELNLAAQKAGITVRVHVALDTGMSRIGFQATQSCWEIGEIERLYHYPHLKIEGYFTHLCHADSTEEGPRNFTLDQKQLFDQMIQQLQQKGYHTGVSHIQNSAGIQMLQGNHYDLARPGIVLYGLHPSGQVTIPGLKPVLQLKSVISMVKEIEANVTVGYSRTFTTKKATKIATVCIGYADGWPRLLSNRGYVLVNGQKVPIIGNVCMDQLMLDVTGIPAKQGDIVTLIGKDGNLEITADQVAESIGTIGYELVCQISKRVPRAIYQNGKLIEVIEY